VLQLRALIDKVPPPIVGAGQLGIVGAFFYWFLQEGGLTIGFLPPSMLLAGKGIANIFTWSR